MTDLIIRPGTDADQPALVELLTKNWGRPFVAIGGVGYDLTAHPSLIAERDGVLVGALVYRISRESLEVLSLTSTGGGGGTALLLAAREHATSLGMRRMWLATANANIDAIRFYQLRGLHLVGVRPGAIAHSRKLKPTIPLTTADGLSLDDEVLLEMRLDGIDAPYAEPERPGSAALVRTVTWRGGETDLWPLLADPSAVTDVVRGMARRFLGTVDLVLGPDPGGMLFGPLVARELEVPFAPVCRDRRFFFQGPHERVSATTGTDQLYAHRAALADGARVLLVDDWSESGSTVRGVADLVADTKANLVAVAYLVDSLRPDVREDLRARGIDVHALVTPGELTG